MKREKNERRDKDRIERKGIGGDDGARGGRKRKNEGKREVWRERKIGREEREGERWGKEGRKNMRKGRIWGWEGGRKGRGGERRGQYQE